MGSGQLGLGGFPSADLDQLVSGYNGADVRRCPVTHARKCMRRKCIRAKKPVLTRASRRTCTRACTHGTLTVSLHGPGQC